MGVSGGQIRSFASREKKLGLLAHSSDIAPPIAVCHLHICGHNGALCPTTKPGGAYFPPMIRYHGFSNRTGGWHLMQDAGEGAAIMLEETPAS